MLLCILGSRVQGWARILKGWHAFRLAKSGLIHKRHSEQLQQLSAWAEVQFGHKTCSNDFKAALHVRQVLTLF